MTPGPDTTREIVAKQLGEPNVADEALLRAHEFLAESLRARAELLARMGHEIRTPLNGIVGITELMLGTELTGEQREFANATMTSAAALTVVINDLLDFSMLEAGALELDVGTFDARRLLDGLALAAPPRARAAGATISAELDDDVPATATADGNRIRHVLMRLAAGAMGLAGGGEVVVNGDVAAREANRVMLKFTLTYEGGDPIDSLDSLLEVHTDSTEVGAPQDDSAATGLGFTVCQQLVELMGGEIGVQCSAAGETTFWFTTPIGLAGTIPYPEDRVRAAPAQAAPPEPAPSSRRRAPRPRTKRDTSGAEAPRLLIADDDPVSQLVLTRQLEARGFAVAVAANGREATELHAGDGFCAIFMDCQMPEVNGYVAAATIRALENGDEHTPIIGMTASGRESDREQCFLSGMDDYVAKPLDQSTLDAALARRLPTYDTEVAGTQPEGSAPLLDMHSRLTDVFRHNAESRGYLIGVFIDESRARIEQLAAAEAVGDLTLMQRLAHALKGTAGAVGTRAFEQVCVSIHDAVVDGRLEDAVALRESLEHVFALTSDLLRKGCPETQDRELALH